MRRGLINIAYDKAVSDIGKHYPDKDFDTLLIGRDACVYGFDNVMVVLPYWHSLSCNTLGVGVLRGVIDGDVITLHGVNGEVSKRRFSGNVVAFINGMENGA